MAGKLDGSAIVSGSISSTQLDNSLNTSISQGGGPKITQIQITDSSYNVLDDTAVSTSGGYIKITGTGFNTGAVVIVGSVNATSTTFVNSTTLNVQVPAAVAGTYAVYVVNADGGTAIAVNGLTYSGTPTWVTSSSLPAQQNNVAISIQLSATGDAPLTYSLAAGNTLPTGLSLSSGGLLSGTVTVGSDTTYSFTVNAIDAQAQDSPRAFTLPVNLVLTPSEIELLVVAGGGSGGGANDSLSGGGGAGGLLYGSAISATLGTYVITVGAGGAATTDTGSIGSNSVAFGCTALGGGGGGRGTRGNHTAGTNGGSGGGGTGWDQFRPGGNATQTNSGGAIGYGNNGAINGAGGGAGAAGGSAGSSIGGIGRQYTQFTGAGFPAGWYAGGGCGHGVTAQNGGGGVGGNYTSGEAGKVNSGGGGGSAYNGGGSTLQGGAGGSGVVIIRYSNTYGAASATTGSPTISNTGGYRTYVFTGSGSITF